MKKVFYLAHPTNSRHKVREWELKMEDKYNIDLLNPFYDMERDDVKDWDAGVNNPRVKHHKEIVEDDLAFIKAGKNGMLVILDENVGVGSLQEIIYGYIWGIDVYVVTELDNYKKHPWIIYHSKQIFNDLTEFENYLLLEDL